MPDEQAVLGRAERAAANSKLSCGGLAAGTRAWTLVQEEKGRSQERCEPHPTSRRRREEQVLLGSGPKCAGGPSRRRPNSGWKATWALESCGAGRPGGQLELRVGLGVALAWGALCPTFASSWMTLC